MQKTNRKIKYVAFLLFLMGTLYLVLQVLSMITAQSRSSSIRGEMIHLSKNEFFSDLRTLLTILFCLAGGIFLWRNKRIGWILGSAVLFLFTIIIAGILLSAARMNIFDASFIIGILSLLLLISAFIILWLKETRQQLLVTGKTYMQMIFLVLFLAVFYFWLQ